MNSQFYPNHVSNATDTRQGQYGSGSYGWSALDQNATHGNVSHAYQNESWQDRSGITGNYSQAQEQYERTETAGAHTQSTYQPRDSYSSQNTHALNNLAYASGLEPSANTATNTSIRQQNPQSTAGYPASHPTHMTQHRVNTPNASDRQYSTKSHTQQQQSNPVTYPVQNESISPSVVNSSLALNAAAALASAVQRRNYQSSQQAMSSTGSRASNSPMTANVQPVVQNAVPRATSSYNKIPPENHHRQPSNQSQKSTSAEYPKTTAITQQGRRTHVPQVRRENQVQSSNATNQRQVSTSTMMNPSSIANLVTAPNDADQRAYDGAEHQESMPNFIDPSQVFNPYHREHERKKIEAARAEAERKAEADRKAETERQAAAERKEREMRMAKELEEKAAAAAATAQAMSESPSSVRANSKSRITKKSMNTASAPLATPYPEPQQTSQGPGSVLTGGSQEEAMAAEMKAMMSRMKEFRGSNPSLFQKLWNDMKSGAPGNTAANVLIPAAVTQTPSPTVAKSVLPVDGSNQNPTPSTMELKKGQASAPPTPATPATPATLAGWVPRNGYRTVVENNPENLPDLGRFPAERRIRVSYSKIQGQTGDTSVSTASTSQPPSDATHTASETLSHQSIPNSAYSTPPVQSGPSTSRNVDPPMVLPEARRRTVAIAAIHTLKANPENATITITAQDIDLLLAQNPSYTDLCERLESRGLQFQRSMFARELLKSVPELQPPTSRNSVPGSLGATSIQSAAEAAPNGISSTAIVTPDPGHMPTQPTQPTQPQPHSSSNGQNANLNKLQMYVAPPPTANGNFYTESIHSRKQMPKTSKTRDFIPPRPEPPVGSKEAAARKRNFAELIDLTSLDDDENYVVPPKQPRVENGQNGHPTQPFQNMPQSGFKSTNQPLRFDPQVQIPQMQALSQPQPPPQLRALLPVSQQTPSQYLYTGGHYNPTPQPLAHASDVSERGTPARKNRPEARTIMTKKIDKSEALRKTYYDPKTIARDILIASGRHPSERPLNVHLAAMLGAHIEIDSDLGKFDWDSVDPGGPPPPKVELVDIPTVPPRLMLDQNIRKQSKLAEADKTRTFPTVTLPPQTKPSDRNTTGPKPVVPVVPEARVFKSQKLQTLQAVQAIKNSGDTDRSKRKISVEIPPNASVQKADRSEPRPIHRAKPMESETPSTTRRRGRPPGSKNKNQSIAALKQQAQSMAREQPRPFDGPPSPTHVSYKCKWVKCTTALHNLDTLKRHVQKKHHPSDEDIIQHGFTCWWKKCQYLWRDIEDKIVPVHTFDDSAEWMTHIEEDHLQPIAAKFGDGPRSSQVGKQKANAIDLSQYLYKPPVGPQARTFSYTDPQSVEAARTRYLADDHGRVTTPLFSHDGNPDRPLDTMQLTETFPPGMQSDSARAAMTAQNAFMKAQGHRTKDTRKIAEEVVRAMEARKKKIGPGIDRGGCTLINEARRSTFIQNPGISRIVDCDH